jgi:hypothetical protein
MTIEKRLSRLEGIVERLANHTTAFIRAASEFNATVTAALQTHSEEIHRHSEEIRRLDAMITRFDEYLRGRGPRNGHKRRGT